jgi:hypothetical protein
VSKIFIYELKDGYGSYPEKENCFGLLTIEGKQKQAYQLFVKSMENKMFVKLNTKRAR